MGETGLFSALTEPERAALAPKLWALLRRQALLFTMDDSTSLPQETAERLYDSLSFTLTALVRARPDSRARLLREPDLCGLLREGQALLRERTARAQQLYAQALRTAPPLENRALLDTLRGLGRFFKEYDSYYFAQEIPCDIDYPLAEPVPASLAGVDYLTAYLERLLLENDFCGRFSPAAARGALSWCCPDWRGQLVNLYENLAAPALGLCVLGKPLAALRLTDADRAALLDRLDPRAAARRTAGELLLAAAEEAAHRLQLGPAGAAYLAAAARALAVRAAVAARSGDLRGAFPGPCT